MEHAAGRDYVIQNTDQVFRLKDPVSAVTHFAGFVLSIIGMPVLLISASDGGCGSTSLSAFALYMFTMILLYGASASYHSFNCASEKRCRVLRKIDHISVFYLIAGTYTPVCTCVLGGRPGYSLLMIIWDIAIAGTAFKLLWIGCPKWVSSAVYIGMGWAAISVLGDLTRAMSSSAFGLLLAGGILYTAGGIIYALKFNFFHNQWFGNHELFHCFVLAGSACHYAMMFLIS